MEVASSDCEEEMQVCERKMACEEECKVLKNWREAEEVGAFLNVRLQLTSPTWLSLLLVPGGRTHIGSAKNLETPHSPGSGQVRNQPSPNPRDHISSNVQLVCLVSAIFRSVQSAKFAIEEAASSA